MQKVFLLIDTNDSKIHFNGKVIGAFRTDKSKKEILNYIYNLYDETPRKLVENRFKIKEATKKDFLITEETVFNQKENFNNFVPINPQKIILPFFEESPTDITDLYK